MLHAAAAAGQSALTGTTVSQLVQLHAERCIVRIMLTDRWVMHLAESLRLGLRHGPRPLSPREADSSSSSSSRSSSSSAGARSELPGHLADASGSASTKAAQVGSRVGLETDSTGGASGSSGGSGGSGSSTGGVGVSSSSSGGLKRGLGESLAKLPEGCNVQPHTE